MGWKGDGFSNILECLVFLFSTDRTGGGEHKSGSNFIIALFAYFWLEGHLVDLSGVIDAFNSDFFVDLIVMVANPQLFQVVLNFIGAVKAFRRDQGGPHNRLPAFVADLSDLSYAMIRVFLSVADYVHVGRHWLLGAMVTKRPHLMGNNLYFALGQFSILHRYFTKIIKDILIFKWISSIHPVVTKKKRKNRDKRSKRNKRNNK